MILLFYPALLHLYPDLPNALFRESQDLQTSRTESSIFELIPTSSHKISQLTSFDNFTKYSFSTVLTFSFIFYITISNAKIL